MPSPPPSPSLALSASLALSLAGCYLAHEREPMAPSHADGGAADAASVDAFVRPCSWHPRPAWQLTTPPGDQTLLDVAAVPDGDFVVAWGSSNDPPPDPARHAQRVGLDGPIGERTNVFDAPRGFFVGGLGLAVGPHGLLAATWDEGGCLVRMLDRAGAPLSAPRTLPLASCVGVHALSGDRFALLDRPGDAPAAVHVLAADGTLVGSGAALGALDGAFWWTRARLDDGSALVIGMREGVEPTQARAQRVSEDGTPLSEPASLARFAAASRVRAIGVADGALAAWLESPDGDPASQDRTLRTLRLDARGAAVAMPLTVAEHAYRDGGLSLARAGSDVFAVYVESSDRTGIETTLSAIRLDAAGTPLERHVLARGQLARSPVARTGDAGVAIAFTAPGPGATQIFVTSLVCE